MVAGRVEAKKVELAYSCIKDLVVNAQFKPGEQLHIAEFCERLDLSPTPVREALSRLSAEDLIVIVPNRGFFCKQLDVEELCALYELATVVLTHSLRVGLRDDRALGCFDGVQFTAEIPVEPLSEPELDRCARRIEALYVGMAKLSGNALIVSCIRSFNDKSHYMRVVDLTSRERLIAICRDLDALTALLKAAKAKEAIAHLNRLLAGKLERMPLLATEVLARAYLAAPESHRQVASGGTPSGRASHGANGSRHRPHLI